MILAYIVRFGFLAKDNHSSQQYLPVYVRTTLDPDDNLLYLVVVPFPKSV